ncbi:hypothetical protein LBMAG42_46380 [Deltaproteobacteria bacterium]|nr:hypothetical protein LBMAG42_46380 [Deltaproteobacteria bacterium]
MVPLALHLLLACSAPPTFDVLLAPDPGRDGADGADGPYGAISSERTYQARVTDAVRVEFVLPGDDGGAPTVPAAPTVVFVQGGLVDVDRYRWLYTHVASRGFAVVAPHHTLDLAIFDIGNASAAYAGARGDPDLGSWIGDSAVVGGHSLGGVVAVKNWLADDAFSAVLLLSSFPAAGDDPEDRAGSPVLSIGGANDQKALPADVQAGFERFGDPRYLAVVDDLNHYGWTDGASEKELASDGQALTLDDDRLAALNVIDAFLDASLLGDADAAARLNLPFDGVTVTR